jgi:NADH:ubiquinone oxidoreductase subunit 4 (subunit M)
LIKYAYNFFKKLSYIILLIFFYCAKLPENYVSIGIHGKQEDQYKAMKFRELQKQAKNEVSQ